jgi:hypothetical protein
MAWEPDYITETEFRNYIKDNSSDNAAEIAEAITSASRAVDRFCSVRPNGMGARRQFGQMAAPVAFYYTARWDTDLMKWVIEIDDLMDTTGLVISVDNDRDGIYESTITDYTLRPQDAIARGRPYTQIAVSNNSSVQPTFFVDGVKGLGRWGWSSHPATVELGTKIQAHRWYKRRVAPYQVSGSPQKGTAQTQPMNEVDPDIGIMLEPYIKSGWTL